MSAIDHGWKPTGPAAKIPLSVAEEFHEADKGQKYGAGQHKGRAMGGPMMPTAGSGGVMPTGMPQQPPYPPMGVVSPMASQMPVNGQPAGIATSATMGPQMGLNAPAPGLNPVQQLATGGAVHQPLPGLFKGSIVSTVPGRTDLHPTHVPSGSYVIPADIVSGHGQGNSLSGMNSIHKLFRMGGGNPSSIPGAATSTKPVKFDRGGADRHVGKPVPVKLAGGEVVVPPENVLETMRRITKNPSLTLEKAQKAMDAWVLKHRKKLIGTLKRLPPPAKD